MPEQLDKLELTADERIYEERPYVPGETLVSDGNSRWLIVDETAYLVGNAHYRAAEEQSNDG